MTTNRWLDSSVKASLTGPTAARSSVPLARQSFISCSLGTAWRLRRVLPAFCRPRLDAGPLQRFRADRYQSWCATGTLAEELRVKPSNVAGLVNALVADGLVKRQQDKAELRANNFVRPKLD